MAPRRSQNASKTLLRGFSKALLRFESNFCDFGWIFDGFGMVLVGFGKVFSSIFRSIFENCDLSKTLKKPRFLHGFVRLQLLKVCKKSMKNQ